MKRKYRFSKGISLLLVVSLLLGVMVVGTLAEDSDAGEVVAQSETTVPPSIGYTRITMENYGIEAPTDEAGKTYTSSLSGTYTGTSMDKTYLDVDINFNNNENTTGYYFHFFGSADWTDNIRFTPKTGGFSVQHTGGKDIGTTWLSCTTSGFVNFKFYTDIVENSADSTQNDVTIRVYVQNEYVDTLAWTETKELNHNNFYFYCSAGSFSFRTPEPWEDYTRITMENYGIEASEAKEGTLYTGNKSGTYSGESLHKTYLDVDMKFEFGGANGTKFYYLSNADWLGLRLTPYTSGLGVYHTREGSLKTTWISCKLPESEFFNLKLLTDIAENAEDTTKNDVQVRVYVNDELVQTLTWTENIEEEHNKFIFEYVGSFSLRTPLLSEDIDYGYDISTYRTTVNEDGEYTSYPTKTDYVFGGWYSDVYLTEPLDASVTTGYAYAKFVPEDVLTVKFQKLANASKEDETTSLRPVTAVDSLDYEYVGFKRLVEGDTTEKVYKTKSVYKTIKGTVNGETYTYTPSVISDDAEYLMALSINKIPQSVYDKTITITPLWKTLDGTVVTGESRDIELFAADVEGGTTLYGGEEFENDNEAYYKSSWIY